MKRKILLAALALLLLLPAIGFTQDVEVTDVSIKWAGSGESLYTFRAKIWVTNHGDRAGSIIGFLAFYDGDGFEITRAPFSGRLQAGESRILATRGFMMPRDYEDMVSHELIVEPGL